jgi:aldose 1-epimerase
MIHARDAGFPNLSRRGFLAAAGVAAGWAFAGSGRTLFGQDASNPQPPKKGVYIADFGVTPGGAKVEQYTLANANGMIVQVLSYGARVQRILALDRNGEVGDVALGFNDLPSYLAASDDYFGATIGRFAGRIADGTFTLNGQTYHIPVNDGSNALDGGPDAWDRKIWTATGVTVAGSPGVRFNYFSPAGENGFPGDVEAETLYVLTDDNSLHVNFRMTSDAPTIVNPTNHTYFNLNGPGSTILNHGLQVLGNDYLPVNDQLIPTGDIVSVERTALDFRQPQLIGLRLKPIPDMGQVNEKLLPYGYDYTWCLNSDGKSLILAARLEEPISGRSLECWTTQPAIQICTGNQFDGSLVGIGGAYPHFGGITLAPSGYPDAPNHSNFPSTVLNPGPSYFQQIAYRFGTL